MVIFIIFLFVNIFTTGIFVLVYGGKQPYGEGMLLGVHIPDYAVHDPDVDALMKTYRKRTKRFYLTNFFISAAICFLNFWYFSIFLIAWSLWIVELCTGAIWLLYGTHKKLYALKMDRGWEADIEQVYGDDDVYWKNGWYNNPNDKRLWVPDRFCSSNYATNMARPAGKIFTFGLLGGTAVLLLILFVVFLRADFTPRYMELSGHTVQISSPMSPIAFDLKDVKDFKLLDKMPEGNFTRTNGLADDRQLVGKFREKETGDYRMYVYKKHFPVLQIHLPEYTVLINSDEKGQTESWYQELADRLPELTVVEK
ncbi:hypothetical protein [Clostridium sp. C105KSO13]|uniref:hypothetical protein n=1 Tax=Clostridium sp. C105KSO13 TaxID=1776045 RepID=UPI00074085EA|nr:hypothetical protein [Clostridium sp. C105KSO13]CUX41255.1 hypothetical protein BN3456_02141 [Clostridium sp. C105KSO13]